MQQKCPRMLIEADVFLVKVQQMTISEEMALPGLRSADVNALCQGKVARPIAAIDSTVHAKGQRLMPLLLSSSLDPIETNFESGAVANSLIDQRALPVSCHLCNTGFEC